VGGGEAVDTLGAALQGGAGVLWHGVQRGAEGLGAEHEGLTGLDVTQGLGVLSQRGLTPGAHGLDDAGGGGERVGLDGAAAKRGQRV
jgi:hypothetical protein